MYRTGNRRAMARQASLEEWRAKAGQCSSTLGELPPSLDYGGTSRLCKPAIHRMECFYVYILQSEAVAETFYVGFTEDLRTRLKTHNAGQVFHTAKFRPWKIKTAVAFTDRQRAIEFEQYLKSASGRAFAKKRL